MEIVDRVSTYPGRVELIPVEGQPNIYDMRHADQPVVEGTPLNKATLDFIIPAGIICMWSGAANAIPYGWAICNGSNGTPDLRGRFVLGAGGTYSVGAMGGVERHKLTVAEMPSHSHRVIVGTSSGGSTEYITTHTLGGSKYLSGTSSEGSSTAHNNMPPYYALCYIMKL